MNYKRMISLLLAFVMVLGMLSGCSGEPDAPQESQAGNQETMVDEEIQKAIDLGLVPEALQGDYDTQISYAEFCGILDAMIGAVRPDCLDAWQERSADFREADDPMTRMEGMLVLFYAAECTGVDAIGFWESIALQNSVPGGMDFWEGIGEYPLLPDAFAAYKNDALIGTDYEWVSGQQYADAAVAFTQCYSFGNGNTYFDFDENYMLNFGAALTRGDAIRAAERLYETIRFFTYVSAENAMECDVSAESIALAEKMPAATYDALPKWNGHAIIARDEFNNFGLGRNYTEEEVEAIALSGFNFVRVPLKFDQLFNGTDMTQVCSAYLETIDDLLNWCAKYGIHVCFDLHDMPGYTTNGDDSDDVLFHDEESQRYFVGFWQFIAQRYKDVPSNLLSFNLLNEPHGDSELTDEAYSAVMRKAIDAVRAASPNRLMIASTLGVTWGAPVRGLADAEVAQGFSGYILADGTEQWPHYYINQCFHAAEGDIVLKGDFPAGTELVLKPLAFVSAKYEILADGTQVCGFDVDGATSDGSGCMAASGDGTVEWSQTDHYICRVTLPENCKEIRISETANGYGEILGMVLNCGDFTVTINGDVNRVGHPTPAVLTIHSDGTVTAEEPESLLIANVTMIQEMLKPYLDFKKQNGVDFIVLECGTQFSIPGDVACTFTEDFLSALDADGISWCCWGTSYSPLTHQQMPERRFMFNGEQWLREGHTYENVTENWIADTELMEVYKKHIK